MRALCVVILVGALLGGCAEKLEGVVLIRSNCLVCHRPLDELAQPKGIEEAHPWAALECEDCHGGNPWVCSTGETTFDDAGNPLCDGAWIFDQDLAHEQPDEGTPRYLRNLSSQQLDNVDVDYLQFVNPGDFRVAPKTCGAAECHAKEVAAVPHSTMAHTSGEVTVARYRAMKQSTPHGEVGAVSLTDPNKDPDVACQSESIEQFSPEPIDPLSTDPEFAPTVANAQDQYMVKSCFRCHLNDFGENKFPGDFRSSGCTGCHMNYHNDGLSRSKDPRINKQTVPHAITHQLTTSPPVATCTHCHYRGGRIGISFQGYRESGGKGLNPDNPGTLGEPLHAHGPEYYLTDEDITNDCDETPADLHFEAGMHCVDCHTTVDVHGDSHLYADTQCAVTSGCEDCHGSVRERAKADPKRNTMFEKDGKLFLETKFTKKTLEVPQTIDSLKPGSLAELAMGVNADGFSHTDNVECYTCHAAWMPSCYGCHVEVDLTRDSAYHTTGVQVPGKSSGFREWVVLNDMVLIQNSAGKLAPSMPAERFFMSLFKEDPDAAPGDKNAPAVPVFEGKPRTFTFPDGRTIAGFGQRAFNPHTTRRKSQFMACDRCHSAGSKDAPTNKVLMDVTHGFGSQRFMREGCDVSNDVEGCGPDDQMTYALDAVINAQGEPLVVIGHPDPVESRVLTLEEIERMRAVVVGASPLEKIYTTKIADDALTNWKWPSQQLCYEPVILPSPYAEVELDPVPTPAP